MYENVYVTCLTNENYLPGVFVLGESLKKVKSRFPLCVLIPNDKPYLGEIVRKHNPDVLVLLADNIQMPPAIKGEKHYWIETFFKLRALSLTQFKKIILIDSDMMVLRNIDHLFNADSMSAVVAGEIKNPEWKDLNSGLVVIEPKTGMAELYINSIPVVYKQKQEKGLSCGDQDVFHFMNKDWHKHNQLKLPEGYNQFFRYCGYFVKTADNGIRDLYIVHFVGKTKPWQQKLMRIFLYHLLRFQIIEARLIISYHQYLKKYKQISKAQSRQSL